MTTLLAGLLAYSAFTTLLVVIAVGGYSDLAAELREIRGGAE